MEYQTELFENFGETLLQQCTVPEWIKEDNDFKKFLITGELEIDGLGDKIEWIKLEEDEDEEDEEIEEEEKEVFYPFQISFYKTDEYYGDDYELAAWNHNKTLRLQIITGSKPHPNKSLVEELVEFFKQKKEWEKTQTVNYNEHYSNVSELTFAFDIKVHENFAPQILLDHKIISWDMESDNRHQVIENFIAYLKESPSLGDTTFKWSIAGRGGGYLQLKLTDLNAAFLKEAEKEIEERKQTEFSYYQTSYEHYEHYIDEIKEKIEELQEEGNEDSAKELQDILFKIENVC